MTSRSFALPASLLLAAVVACGGAPPSQPATPATPAEPTAPTAPTEPVAATPNAAAPAAAAARPTMRGPNLTPDGVVFNFKPDGKPAKIFLAGNFNAWNPSDPKYLLKDDGPPNGLWSITVKLPPGTYQYKFVADGKWIKDPSSPGSAPDGFGGQNGQFDVK